METIFKIMPIVGNGDRQDSQWNETRRQFSRAADEVRAGGKSKNRQADRSDDSAQRAGAGGQSTSAGMRRKATGARKKKLSGFHTSGTEFNSKPETRN